MTRRLITGSHDDAETMMTADEKAEYLDGRIVVSTDKDGTWLEDVIPEPWMPIYTDDIWADAGPWDDAYEYTRIGGL
jgi:hypothetical protein